MKPKNKFQKQVLEASKKLPPLSGTQIQWAYQNCIEHIGRRTEKGVITCTECGHKWQGDGYLANTLLGCECPGCKTKLTVKTTRKRVFDDYQYFCMITVCEGFQVVRFFYIGYKAKTGEKAQYSHSEVVQRWIAPNGKYATIAKLRPMGYFVETWCFGSPLEIRPENPLYNIIPTCIYPRQKCIPELKRNGFTGEFYDIRPFDLFRAILSDPKAETLLKAKQYELLKQHITSPVSLSPLWASVRICLRNNYLIEDASLWLDYLATLYSLGKDIRNAHYICPENLKTAHDHYMHKRDEIRRREKLEQQRQEIAEAEERYNQMKERFFDVEFSDGLICINVLSSVKDFFEEGFSMHHCVFSNEYYLKPDSLVLSARINGERIETIEISLKTLQVVQSRGVCNKTTPYHEQIVELVNKNMNLIQRRLAS